MSLINQMLQELDARRSDATTTGSYGQQVRAVQPRRRVHPAWWVALALAGALSGVLGWIYLHPPAQQPSPLSGAQLPLKLDIDLTANSSPEQTTDNQEKREPSVPVQDRPENTASISATIPAQVESKPFPEQAATEKRLAVTRPAAAAKRASTSPLPELAQVTPLLKSQSVPEVPPIAVPGKQFKEHTPQQRAENEYRKAVQALQQGKPAEAASGFEQALQLDPQHAPARQALIAVLVESKRIDEAITKAGEGLGLDPKQPGLAMILARLQLEKGQLRDAVETLEKTLPYIGDRVEYRAFLAALLQRSDRHKQAAEQYLLALQRAPQNGIWWVGLGISLEAEHRLPEAQEAFKRAKAGNSLSPDLRAFVEGKLNPN